MFRSSRRMCQGAIHPNGTNFRRAPRLDVVARVRRLCSTGLLAERPAWLEWCERVPPMENHNLFLQARTIRNPYPQMMKHLLKKYPDLRFQDCYVDGNDWSAGNDTYRDDHPVMQFVARQLDAMRTEGMSKKEAFAYTEQLFRQRRQELEQEQKVMMAMALDSGVQPMFSTGRSYLEAEVAKAEVAHINKIRKELRLATVREREKAEAKEKEKAKAPGRTEEEVFNVEVRESPASFERRLRREEREAKRSEGPAREKLVEAASASIRRTQMVPLQARTEESSPTPAPWPPPSSSAGAGDAEEGRAWASAAAAALREEQERQTRRDEEEPREEQEEELGRARLRPAAAAAAPAPSPPSPSPWRQQQQQERRLPDANDSYTSMRSGRAENDTRKKPPGSGDNDLATLLGKTLDTLSEDRLKQRQRDEGAGDSDSDEKKA